MKEALSNEEEVFDDLCPQLLVWNFSGKLLAEGVEEEHGNVTELQYGACLGLPLGSNRSQGRRVDGGKV